MEAGVFLCLKQIVDNCQQVNCRHKYIFIGYMNLKEKFGLKIRMLRENKGYSAEYLANISNIDRTYISDIENGKRNVSLLIIEKLAKALEVKIKDLFDDEE